MDQIFHEGAVLVHEVNTAQPWHDRIVDGRDQPQDDLLYRQLFAIAGRVRGLIFGFGSRRRLGCYRSGSGRIRAGLISRLIGFSRSLSATACYGKRQQHQQGHEQQC